MVSNVNLGAAASAAGHTVLAAQRRGLAKDPFLGSGGAEQALDLGRSSWWPLSRARARRAGRGSAPSESWVLLWGAELPGHPAPLPAARAPGAGHWQRLALGPAPGAGQARGTCLQRSLCWQRFPGCQHERERRGCWLPLALRAAPLGAVWWRAAATGEAPAWGLWGSCREPTKAR